MAEIIFEKLTVEEKVRTQAGQEDPAGDPLLEPGPVGLSCSMASTLCEPDIAGQGTACLRMPQPTCITGPGGLAGATANSACT